MGKDIPTPRWIIVVQAIGSFALGLGTFALAIATGFKVPEIYDVVNKVKGLDETVVTIRESISLSNDILSKVEVQIDFIAFYLAEKNSQISDKEQLNTLLKRFAKSQPKYYAHAANHLHKVDDTRKILNTWESLESDNKRKEYLYELFKGYFATGELNAS